MITLILLAVITFMAVTFLVVSRSERGAVSVSTDQMHARLAADAALERAKAELLAPIIAFTNPFAFDLKVSTTFVNQVGFIPNNPNPTNVSYSYANGNPVSGNDALQNIANLFYYPRPPVFITNRFAGGMDFRFYLDLNRNGLYDTNGYQAVINPFGGYYDTNGAYLPQPVAGLTLTNFLTGDPEWVGGLEFPDRRHSADNKFLWRYAYVVMPEGKTLDINSIHNYAKRSGASSPNMPRSQGDRFYRNQGVGTWEINLAAFLSDLNTNFWPYPVGNTWGAPYSYVIDDQQPNTGAAFDDALSLLRFRYRGNRSTGLASVDYMYGAPGVAAFRSDFVDGYTSGPLMTSSWWQAFPDADLTITTQPWSGANNTNNFFTPQDFFAKGKIALGQAPVANELTFSDRLLIAGTNQSTYDRHTFYRLLSQLGTDAGPEQDTRINVNYDNKVQRSNGLARVENYIPWKPIDFFMQAGDRLLAEGAPRMADNKSLSVTNIPIWPTNYYSASVHRMLQLAANVYDATTNRVVAQSSPRSQIGLPTIFRPLVNKQGTNVFIVGYEQLRTLEALTNSPGFRMRDMHDAADMAQTWGPKDMVYGIPVIVGAKKGYPNFNEFAMQTWADVTRKLEFRRPNLSSLVTETNQMYIVGLSNIFGVETWNSYSNFFPRALGLQVAADISVLFSNEFGVLITNRFSRGYATNYPINTWAGYQRPGALRIPLTNLVSFLPTSVYRNASRRFVDIRDPASTGFERNQGFPVPNWWMTVRSRVRFVLTTPHPDGAGNAIVDYVNLAATEDTVFLPEVMQREGVCNTPNGDPGSQWCTNRVNNRNTITTPTYGIISQVHASLGNVDVNNWIDFLNDPTVGGDRKKAIDSFRSQFSLGPMFYQGMAFHRSNVFYAPLVPRRTIYQTTTWQANDPLVHYTVGDLVNIDKTNNITFIRQNPALPNLGVINDRYEPWGGNPNGKSASPTMFALEVKDPLVRRSDDWEFPTNKFPNIGWIGRVHRGTPWQTVYLKSPGVDTLGWARWSGNAGTVIVDKKEVLDAEFTQPWRDRYLVDVFTAALNDNATRGQLSVNQSGMAAWSAVLSGAIALTNIVSDTDYAADPQRLPQFGPVVVQPAGTYDPGFPPPVARIVNAINDTRATNGFVNQVFNRMGDVLSVPELTVGRTPKYIGTYPNGYWTGVSPFLNLGDPNEMDPNAADPQNRYSIQQRYGLNEAAYERIPQQILGLLRGDSQPRFVVYSYGQALKPAPRSRVTDGGPFVGLYTNYQVTAEVATRAVVRVEGAPEKPQIIVEQYNVLPPD